MAPGLFDVLALGAYLSLAAGIYLVLVAIGKVRIWNITHPQPIISLRPTGNDTPA